MKSLKGISSIELERLLKDDPEFAKILLNQQNISGKDPSIAKKNNKNKPPKPKPKPINISKPKPKPKIVIHKTNDPSKSNVDPRDPKYKMCDDPKCTICEKPKPKPSNKPNNKPKNISILDNSWLKRIAKLTPKYPKMAHVFDWYVGKSKGVTVLEVKDNIIYYEKLKGKKEN